MQYFEGLREEEEKNLLQSIDAILSNEEYSDDPDYLEYLACKAIEEYVEYRIAERMENKK